MKLAVFHAADGDCVLVTSSDSKNILVDGGRTDSFASSTREHLAKIPAAQALDVVMVSHIDDDHISGVVRLVEDEVAYRAWEIALQIKKIPKPKFPRPRKIGEIWHNNLYRLLGNKSSPEIEAVLGSASIILASTRDEKSRHDIDNITTGYLSSMALERRLTTQLGIPINPQANGKLVKRKTTGNPATARRDIGSLTFSLLGPSQTEIDALRKKWKEFVDAPNKLDELHQKMLDDERRLGVLPPQLVVSPKIDQELGKGAKSVTEANVASLMFHVSDTDGSTLLLTGDGRSDEILQGLAYHKKLDANGRIHVNVLKVQHHGALGNVTKAFVDQVTADHYVFCANGASNNPEVEVVEAFGRARLGANPIGPATPFKFWFTSSSKMKGLTDGQVGHMKEVEDAVAKLRKNHTKTMLVAALTTKTDYHQIDPRKV